jgi:hypothetical protein
MGKAKPVSLHPLTFHEALKALVVVDPDRVGLVPKRRKKRKRLSTKRLHTKGSE